MRYCKGAKDILSKSKDISVLVEIHNLSEDINFYYPVIKFLNLHNFKLDFEKLHDGGKTHNSTKTLTMKYNLK